MAAQPRKWQPREWPPARKKAWLPKDKRAQDVTGGYHIMDMTPMPGSVPPSVLDLTADEELPARATESPAAADDEARETPPPPPPPRRLARATAHKRRATGPPAKLKKKYAAKKARRVQERAVPNHAT